MAELASQLCQEKGSLFSFLWTCILAVEKLSWEIQQFKKDMFDSNLYKEVPQVLEIRVPLFKRNNINHGANAVCLRLHRGEARKWDGKSTSALEVWVFELIGKKILKRNAFVQNFQGNCCFSFQWVCSKAGRKADLSSDINKDTFYLYLQEGNDKYRVRD